MLDTRNCPGFLTQPKQFFWWLYNAAILSLNLGSAEKVLDFINQKRIMWLLLPKTVPCCKDRNGHTFINFSFGDVIG